MSYKVILSLSDVTCKSKDIFEHSSYQCHPDHVYVVVGKYFNFKNISINTQMSYLYLSTLGNKSDWLDLAEWLVDRGAQKVVIAVKRCLMSSNNCRRFVNNIFRFNTLHYILYI